MRPAVSLLLLLALLVPSFPIPLIAQEVGSSTPPVAEEVASSTPQVEELVITEGASTTEEIASTTEPEGAVIPEQSEANLRTLAAVAIPTLSANEQFLINQPDASQDIVLAGAGGGADVYIEPAPVYIATASGEVSSVRMYLARNSVVGFGQTIRLEFYNPVSKHLICSLVYADSNPSSQHYVNYAPIPVGTDAVLVEFTHFLLFPDKPSCAITEGVSYEVRLKNIVIVDPRFEEGILYTKGANGSNEFFLQVIGEVPPPPPEPTPPPVVPGTILAKSTDAAWDRNVWTTGFGYNIAFQDSIIQEGTLTHIVMPLSFFYDAAQAPLFFQLRDGFGGLYDCKTPIKTLSEWGIFNDTRANGVHYNTVTIGPFSGTECDTTLRITQNRGNTIGLNVYTTDPGTYQNVGGNLAVAGHVAPNGATEIPFIVYSATSTPPVLCTENCNSSVLFLPGIKGSRLFINENSVDRKLWEPNGQDDVPELFLDDSGHSIRGDVYAKRGVIVDDIAFNTMNIYDSFIEDMDDLQEAGSIQDWEAVPYDWRLSLNDIVSKGAEHNGRIYYDEATTTPYIEQTLRELAASSKTGKVTLIAHSNGGLVTKALLQKLGDAETAELVDKIIFVAVPQSGAPQALGALLYGQKERLPADEWIPYTILSQETARAFAEHSPMTYHLLPSQAYFDTVQEDDAHPVARFTAATAYSHERAAYGPVIGTFTELSDYLQAFDGGRTKPAFSDVETPNVLSASFVNYGRDAHANLDGWAPPVGVKTYQIAGWGEDTISGIEFYEECSQSVCEEKYRPMLVQDGDGVVPTPSALLMPESDYTERYWLDLTPFGVIGLLNRDHGNIFEVQNLRDFTAKLIKNETGLPSLISKTQPPNTIQEKKLRFILHSPLTLELFDEEENKVGIDKNGAYKSEIEGATYGEFGEVKYITVPANQEYRLEMHGLSLGKFSLDIQEVIGNEVIEQSTIADVPSTADTEAILTITDAIDSASALQVDKDGDGLIDFSLAPEGGETVFYQTDTLPPVTISTISGALGQNGWYAGTTTVSLEATDTGSGVASTSYSLNNEAWLPYSVPLAVTKEGTTTLQFYSIDHAGNKEATNTQTLKIDKTAPEALIIFDASARALKIARADNLSATSTPVLVGSAVSTTLVDTAGNPLKLTYSKNEQKSNSTLLNIYSLKYSKAATTSTPSLIRYYWLNGFKASNPPAIVLAHIKTSEGAILALYIGTSNKTIIMSATAQDDTADLKVLATALLLKPRATIKQYAGMVIPYTFTQRGKVKIGY